MLARINRNYAPVYWDDFFNDKFFKAHTTSANKCNVPAVNVVEDEKSYSIEMAAPGVAKEDFKIDLDNNMLTISNKQEESKEENKTSYLRREFSYSNFERSFELPDSIDVANIKANYNSGVLSISLPKKAEVVENAHRQIKISNK